MNHDVTRSFPHSLPAEKSTLSNMLQSGAEFVGRAVEAGIKQEHYYDPGRSLIFEVLCDRVDAGLPTDIETMVQNLIDSGKLDRIGGVSVFTDIYSYAPTAGNFDFHIKALKDKWTMRQLLNFCAETENAIWDSPDEVDDLLDVSEKSIMSIREGREVMAIESISQTVNDVCMDFQERLNGKEKVVGISTGFEELDRMTGGLKPGNMVIIAARPSMGKTAFMMNIIEHVSVTNNIPSLVFSLEMTRREIVQRALFSMAKFDSTILSRGEMPTKGDYLRLRRQAEALAGSNIIIDDTHGITISQIRAKARRMKRAKDIQIIAIDYLGLVKSPSKQSVSSREREIAEISAGIKGLAKELGIPIILLAQLNRGPEGRQGKSKTGKPKMSDLRDSGSIEQDADIVGLLYRDAYYAEDEEQKNATAGSAELDVAKNRNGPTGAIPLTFIKELSRFQSGAPDRQDEPQPESERKSRWNRE